MVALRSSLVRLLPGGMQQLLKICLKQFFGRSEGRCDLRDGITLRLKTKNSLVFDRLGLVIGDEAATKSMMGCKGASGMKLCVCCKNVVDHKSQHLPDQTGFLLPSTSLEVEKFKLTTDHEVHGILKRLEEASNTMKRQDFETLQRNLGFTYNPENPIVDADILRKAISTHAWDWMHMLFIKGAFNVEVGMFFEELAQFTHLSYTSLAEYMQLWTWPKGYASPQHLLSPAQVASCKEAGFLKGGASEMLSLVPVLHRFTTDVVLKLSNKDIGATPCVYM